MKMIQAKLRSLCLVLVVLIGFSGALTRCVGTKRDIREKFPDGESGAICIEKVTKLHNQVIQCIGYDADTVYQIISISDDQCKGFRVRRGECYKLDLISYEDSMKAMSMFFWDSLATAARNEGMSDDSVSSLLSRKDEPGVMGHLRFVHDFNSIPVSRYPGASDYYFARNMCGCYLLERD